jgi:hypothetical protein
VNVRNISNSTPLHEASGNGDLDITRLLLSHGTEVNVFDDRADSPLHKALRFRKSDVAELLVKGGADVNVRDKSNSTPRHETLGIGNPKTAQPRHATDDEGRTPVLATHGKLLNDSVLGENMAGTSCVDLPLSIFNLDVINHRGYSLYLDNNGGGGGGGGGDNGGETLPLSASNFSPKPYPSSHDTLPPPHWQCTIKPFVLSPLKAPVFKQTSIATSAFALLEHFKSLCGMTSPAASFYELM